MKEEYIEQFEEAVPTPVLYILMRTDLDSMNPGKAMAQASHASNQFVANTDMNNTLYGQWKGAKTFGTVLVLEVDEQALRYTINDCRDLPFECGIIHDPTYPLRDGDTTHYIPLDTCGYVFGNKDDPALQELLSDFELHY